ncbi:Hypothetical predicted protein [Olea europaea subsp. europaea]|uniref:Uncharacterized protein n=1 Tax=Olea europaea subsp. europaea TaxID=158383 RepID=A0A8S0SUA8_OLEEU|nr:Hypothetical predicted protein [Olea europaea subsp. europaea]
MDEPNIVVHCTLKPTPKEASKAYWIEIHRFEDEVEDPTVDIFVDKENWIYETGEACDVNEDPLVHVKVQNDENQDGNEEREVEDYVLANEPVIVKEAALPADGNEQKQANDINNYPNPIEVENEQRQATDLPNDDETRVEERDTCVPMNSISHGDVMEYIPIMVEDESDKSSQIGRRMRIKKRSPVLESPFTNLEKRMNRHNVNTFDPFRELDPAKADDLQNWLIHLTDLDADQLDLSSFFGF